MGAGVKIFSGKQLQERLVIPFGSIVGGPELGSTRKCYVLPAGGGAPVERSIVIGGSNERLAEVKEGLEDGDVVVHNPRVLLGEKDKKAAADKPEGGTGKSGPGGGKGDGPGQSACPGGPPGRGRGGLRP